MGIPASVAAAPSSLLLCAAGLVSFRLVLARRRGSSSAPVAPHPHPTPTRRQPTRSSRMAGLRRPWKRPRQSQHLQKGPTPVYHT
eukprot:scaffold56164_cov61-Phaeocystis_antarctica.AAC.7